MNYYFSHRREMMVFMNRNKKLTLTSALLFTHTKKELCFFPRNNKLFWNCRVDINKFKFV